MKQVSEKITLSPVFKNAARIDLIRWDDSLGGGVVSPKDCDIFVMILWNRWGTPIPLAGSHGAAYMSGTHYEFEVALEQAKRTGRPAILVYRRVSPLQIPLSTEPGSLDVIVKQKKMVDEFFESFRDEQGALRLAYHTFDSPADFRTLFESHLFRLVSDELMESGPPVERLLRGAELSSVLPAEKSGGLFLSYRREDSQWAAGRMADRLRAESTMDLSSLILMPFHSEQISARRSNAGSASAICSSRWSGLVGLQQREKRVSAGSTIRPI